MREFRMPSLGADMVKGTLVEWRVAAGDRVTRGQVGVQRVEQPDKEFERIASLHPPWYPARERCLAVVGHDSEGWLLTGQLPAGALLPTTERVAVELAIEPVDVQAAYSRLLADGVLERRADGALCIASHGEEASIGDATQVRFEAALIRAVREAAARGLSSREATGMFKAAVIASPPARAAPGRS
jgi:DNA-binding transcriptional regulator YhcF (GntR family)